MLRAQSLTRLTCCALAYFMQILDTLIEPGHDAPEENASILMAICNDAESSEWRCNLQINQEFADLYRLLDTGCEKADT